MFSEKLIENDIETVCKMTNTLYGFCDELSEYNREGNTKLPEFMEKAEKLMGKNAFYYLFEGGIIQQQRGGDYDFNFELNVINNGGISYDNIGIEDNKHYRVAFFNGKKSWLQKFTIYHELGHLMQYHLNLFSSKEIDKIYHFMSKGVDGEQLSQSEIKRRFVRRGSYALHLLETHAEAFATACMILRSQNNTERKRQMLLGYLNAGKAFIDGMLDKDKVYGFKYYSNFPLQRAVIKEVNSWFSNGEKAKYIDADGNINFEALAKKTHDITLEHAYSPEEFRRFLDYEVFARRSKNEKHTWLSPWGAVVGCIGCAGYKLSQKLSGKENDYIDCLDVINNVREQIPFTPLKGKDKNSKLLNLCCQLDNAIAETNNALSLSENVCKGYDEIYIERAIRYGSIPQTVVKSLSRKIAADNHVIDRRIGLILQSYADNVNEILKTDFDKDALCDIMQAMNDQKVRYEIWDMYYKRLKNPKYPLNLQKFQTGYSKELPITLKNKLKMFKEIRKTIINNNFGEKVKVSPEDRQKLEYMLIGTAAEAPEELKDANTGFLMFGVIKLEPKEAALRALNNTINDLHTLYFIHPQLFDATMKQYLPTLLQSADTQKKKSVTRPKTNSKQR